MDNQKPTLFDIDRPYYEIEEVAKLLRLHQNTIRNWMSKRILPFRQIGRRRVVLKHSLMEWLKDEEVQSCLSRKSS